MRQIRSDVTRARFNEQNVALLCVEVLLAVFVAGVLFQSWLVAGAVFVGIAAVCMSPLAMALVWALAGAWGYVGWLGGSLMFGVGGGVFFGLLMFAVAFAAHQSGVQYVRDVSDASQMDLD